MLACMKNKGDGKLPEVTITVKSSCCNTHKVKFYVDKSNIHEMLNGNIKYSSEDVVPIKEN